MNLPLRVIEKITLTASAASVTIGASSIPRWQSKARHLVLITSAQTDRANAGDNIAIQYNGDGGLNYNNEELYAAGASASAARHDSGATPDAGEAAAASLSLSFAGGMFLIPHAFNSANHKTALSIGGRQETETLVLAHRWASAAAIASLKVLPITGTNFVAGSVFTLCVVDERYLIAENVIAVDGLPGAVTIPAGNDVAIVGYLRTDKVGVTDDGVAIALNADVTEAHYTHQSVTGVDGAAGATAATSRRFWQNTAGGSATANVFSAAVAIVENHAGTTNKHLLAITGYHEASTPYGSIWQESMLWSSTAAITSITLTPVQGTNFVAGSMFSFYRVPKTLIARTVVGSDVASVTFAGIPQGYETLQLNAYAQSDLGVGVETVNMSLNGDVTAADYDVQTLTGVTIVVAAVNSGASPVIMDASDALDNSSTFAGGTWTMPNYASASQQKTWSSVSGDADQRAALRSGRWESVAPVTSIALTPGTGTVWKAGSIFELWGVLPFEPTSTLTRPWHSMGRV